MDLSGKQNQSLTEIICDELIFKRLQNLEDNEAAKLYMFPLPKQDKKSLSMVVLDMARCKAAESARLNSFNKEQFAKKSSEIVSGVLTNQIHTLLFTKQSIEEILSDKMTDVKIVNLQAKEINKMLKDCVIVSFKLPKTFYEEKDTVFSLEGYKFNVIGQIRQNWAFVNNGRVTRDLFALDNQKVKKQVKRNVFYSKSQLKTILELINKVNSLQLSAKEQAKIPQELTLLGENFIHHEKCMLNSNNLLPIINFQIELLFSMGRGETCKNQIGVKSLQNGPDFIQNVCLNFGEGIQNCFNQAISKVLKIVSKQKEEISIASLYKSFNLTTMPTKIANPHLFLKTETKEKFSQYYVKGLYEYYHYGDHNFNDQGWGCAYRSLETLLSWFRLQQKLKLLTVPTVQEIQNIIDLIDCTSDQKLSNSNTWIGATEVSWVVKKLTGFDCRILHIKDGKDIVEQAEMFRDHLQNVGTPIMYGGDEYAYSIVGINYSWKLGEIMFCILDPHYNGSDKIEKIIEKKGISWRKPEQMFRKGVFYNFCLPIV